MGSLWEANAMMGNSKAFLSLDLQSRDFHRANTTLDELIHLMRSTSAADGQTIAELSAGKEYIKAPVASRTLIEELLLKPLLALETTASEKTRRFAAGYLKWLLKNLEKP